MPMTTTEKELLALGTLKLRNAEVYVVPVAKGQVKEDTVSFVTYLYYFLLAR